MGAVLGAEIRVVDVAVDHVAGHAVGMQLAAQGISLHSDADQVVGAEQVERLLAGERHELLIVANRRLAVPHICEADVGVGSAISSPTSRKQRETWGTFKISCASRGLLVPAGPAARLLILLPARP